MKKEVILIVDDEQNYLDTITDTLEERNFKIIQALNARHYYHRLGNARNERH